MDDNPGRSFDLRQMSNALPTSSSGQSYMDNRRPSAPYVVPAPAGMMGPGNHQYSAPVPQYAQQRPDPTAFARAQQQLYLPHNYAIPPAHYPMASRPQSAHTQTQPQYQRVDAYAYPMAQPGYSPVDMRYSQQTFPIGYGPPGGYQETGR